MQQGLALVGELIRLYPVVATRSLPLRQWYVVSLSRDLGRKPIRVEVLSRAFVLYRDQGGQAVAHLDRCPHRNVPLSKGRCLPDDTLECPYHGWRFSPDGQCTLIPGKVCLPTVHHRVMSFSTWEERGLVWLCPDEEGRTPHEGPQVVHDYVKGIEAPLGKSIRPHAGLLKRISFPGGLHAVVENALDVPHTAILHRGLFRGAERNSIEVILRRYRDRAEAQYLGEPPPRGIVARLLALGNSAKDLQVDHWDRFYLPGILQVEYRLGKKTRFQITGYCCPVSEEETIVFAVASVSSPLGRALTQLLLTMIVPFALGVVRQDVRILEAQRQTIQSFGGECFMSTEIDIMGGAIRRILKECVERERTEGSPSKDETPQGKKAGDQGETEEPREVTRLVLEA